MQRCFKLIVGGLIFAISVWILALFLFENHAQNLRKQGILAIPDVSVGQTSSSLNFPYQGIVVLTGGQGRIALAAQLLQLGIAPEMLITGVGGGSTLSQILPDLPEKWHDVVHLGRVAGDTFGNVEETRQWLQKFRERTLSLEDTPLKIILVSTHYHLPRAMHLFTQSMPDIDWIPYAVTPEGFVLDNWYQQMVGWRLLSKELLKFLLVLAYDG